MTIQEVPTASPLTGVTVSDAMRPGVVTCLPGDGVARLAAIMVTNGIHAAVLAPFQRAAPLIVTDLELIRAALDRADDPRAADIARDPVATLPGDAALQDAVAMMAERYVAHLLVTDPDSGEPAGVVSSFDVVVVLSGQQPRLPRILQPAPARPSPRVGKLSQAVVRDVMQPGIATCTPDMPLRAVAGSMAEHGTHCVAIAGIDGGGRGQHLIWRLIGAMDLVRAAHRHALAEPAATIAATAPIAVKEGDSLEGAAALMVEHDTRHVVVVAPSGLPSGLVSTLDVASVLAATGDRDLDAQRVEG
jgi:CBS domain-containing protein